MGARTAIRSLALTLGLIAAAGPALARYDDAEFRPPLDASTLRTAAVVAIRACAVEAARDCRGAPDVLLCVVVKPVRSRRCSIALQDSSVLFEALEICERDLDRFCSDVPPGRGRVMTCLADNYDLISTDCYVSLATGAQEYRARY